MNAAENIVDGNDVKRRRVVITGAGVVSALGLTRKELHDRLLNGENAVRSMPEWSEFMQAKFDVVAACVNLDPAMVKLIDRRRRRSMANAALFAAIAAKSAVEESALTPEMLSSGRCGCIASSTVGSASAMFESCKAVIERRFEDLSACQFFKLVSHSSAFNTANLFGITGVQISPCSACASSLQAIGLAYEQILAGRQEIFLAGGSDEATAMVTGSFSQLYALAENSQFPPSERSRPFDSARGGLVCGEGAGMLVVEELGHALSRGASILAEIKGYATNCNGSEISQSDSASIARCMRAAMDDAGIGPGDVDYLSAHATSTVAGDREEAAAIREVFSDGVPVSSLKGALGHTLGASGAIETAAVLEMMARGEILPTANLVDVAEDCSGISLPKTAVRKRLGTVLKNCIAFGGVNASLVISEFAG